MKNSIKLLVLMLIMSFSIITSAQNWERSNCPYQHTISSIFVINNNIFAGSDYLLGDSEGVFLSTDNGLTWKSINNGLKSPQGFSPITENGNDFFVGTHNGLYKSVDYGNTWSLTDSSIKNQWISSLCFKDSMLFISTESFKGGIFISKNNTDTCVQIYNNYTVNCLVSYGRYIFASTAYGIVSSADNGLTWDTAGLSNVFVMPMAVINNKLYAGTLGQGVYMSSDSGLTWIQDTIGMANNSANLYITSFTFVGDNIFIGTDAGTVFMSTNNNPKWTQVGSNVDRIGIKSLAINNDYLFAGTYSGIWKYSLVDILSVNKINVNNITANVYPNPSYNTFNFDINNDIKNGSILIITNMIGETICVLKTISKHNLIDLSNQQPGVYFITVKSEDDAYSYKIIKE